MEVIGTGASGEQFRQFCDTFRGGDYVSCLFEYTQFGVGQVLAGLFFGLAVLLIGVAVAYRWLRKGSKAT